MTFFSSYHWKPSSNLLPVLPSGPVSLVKKNPKPTTTTKSQNQSKNPFCFSIENHHIYLDKSELCLLSAKEKLFKFSICSAGRANLGSTHITHALPNSSSLPCLQQMLLTSTHLLLPHKLLLCALGIEGYFLSNKPVTAAGKHIGRWRLWCESEKEREIGCSQLPPDS